MTMASTTTSDHRPRLLAIRPKSTGLNQGGDEVMYAKSFPWLRERWELDVLELEPVSAISKVLKLATMTPPECTRFLSRANKERVLQQLARHSYATVLLVNEVTFPMLPAVKQAGVPAVLVAHNVHSLVAATDPGRMARAFRPVAVAFERRFYADSSVRLVAISEGDVVGLRAAGVMRDDVFIAPPGAPPSAPLSADAELLAEAVITGSYGWWRKRRDLARFARTEGGLGVPILAADEQARSILGEQAAELLSRPGLWSEGVRFGLVTDAFVGGFKLKTTEYIAQNCIVLSCSDVLQEFAGLPHASEFVRVVSGKNDAARVIADFRRQDSHEVIERFLEFKRACTEKYEWTRCLAPLEDAIKSSIGARNASAMTKVI